MIRTPLKSNNKTNLEAALKKCQLSARKRYKIASDNLKETSFALNEISTALSNCLETYNNNSVRSPEILKQLKVQFIKVLTELDKLQKDSKKDLEDRKENLDRFSITLFGRTMAGKSTLMEILTKGDGKSIGSGAQRTTRDVRTYQWKNLEITDVPGIAAFEGETDEKLAFHSASQADLVIFLITDDAPQPIEAECLAKVRSLGKPIIGICNVKIAINGPDDFKLFLSILNRKSNPDRLTKIYNQFHEFADQYIPGKHIEFIATHLHSRFIAKKREYLNFKTELTIASRFKYIEKEIINEVTERGSFLRIKSFIDGAITPMIELSDILLDYSAKNTSAGRVLSQKQQELKDRSIAFIEEGKSRIHTKVSKLIEDLRQEVSDFAEEHYDDNNAGGKWAKLVDQKNINKKCEKLLKQLSEKCGRIIEQTTKEIKKEITIVSDFASDKSISMDKIFDSKRWWNWGITSVSGGLGIVAIIISSGPIGWIAATVGAVGWLFSLFFDDREKKANRARKNLSKKLHDNIDKIERKVRSQLLEWFNNELVKKHIELLSNDIRILTNALFDLANAQRTLAWTLNKRIKYLNRVLVEEGLVHIKIGVKKYHISDIARKPGSAIMFLITHETKLPEKIISNLEHLFSERINLVTKEKDPRTVLSRAIGKGCERENISIESEQKIAHVALDNLDAETKIRVKLAQQLTELYITK